MASGIVLTGHNYYLVLGPAVCSSVSYAPKLAEGTFEDIPKIRHVAPDSAGP
jgi:hypothetical protein